jgi:UDP-glucose 4-epimerase
MLSSDRIIITGANGFVGGHLSTALQVIGLRVTQLVRSKATVSHKEVTQIVVDLNDSKRLKEIISTLQPNYVIHLAASKDRVNSGAQFCDSYQKNVVTSLNLISFCLDLPNFKRFIFLGSCDEYGQAICPFDEEMREMPANAYGLSKLAVTKILAGLYQSHQFPSVVLRPTVIYGSNQGSEMFLSALIQSLLSKKDFAMTHGNQFRDFVHVDDVVDAIIKAIYAGNQVDGKVVNIGAGVSHQVKKIAFLVANLIHPDAYTNLKFGAVQYRSHEVMDYAVNIMLAKQLLGWNPHTQLENGLQKTINHFLANIDTKGRMVINNHA